MNEKTLNLEKTTSMKGTVSVIYNVIPPFVE